MLRVLLAGNGEKDTFSSEYLATLKLNEYGYLYISGNGFEINAPLEKGHSFLILDSILNEKISGFNADILIIKGNNLSKLTLLKDVVKKNGYIFFDSENKNNLKIFKEITSNIIDCGINEKNTVTISSILADKITISIQREIKSIYNKTIEPQEYTVKANAQSEEISSLIICAAVLRIAKLNQA